MKKCHNPKCEKIHDESSAFCSQECFDIWYWSQMSRALDYAFGVIEKSKDMDARPNID